MPTRRRSRRLKASIAAHQKSQVVGDGANEDAGTSGISPTAAASETETSQHRHKDMLRADSQRGTVVLNAGELQALKHVRTKSERSCDSQRVSEGVGSDIAGALPRRKATVSSSLAAAVPLPPPDNTDPFDDFDDFASAAAAAAAVDATGAADPPLPPPPVPALATIPAISTMSVGSAAHAVEEAAQVIQTTSGGVSPPPAPDQSPGSASSLSKTPHLTPKGHARGESLPDSSASTAVDATEKEGLDLKVWAPPGLSLKVMPFAPAQGQPRPPSFAVPVGGAESGMQQVALGVGVSSSGVAVCNGSDIDGDAATENVGVRPLLSFRRQRPGSADSGTTSTYVGSGFCAEIVPVVGADGRTPGNSASQGAAGGVDGGSGGLGVFVRLPSNKIDESDDFTSHWPLIRDCVFKIGSTEFLVTAVDVPPTDDARDIDTNGTTALHAEKGVEQPGQKQHSKCRLCFDGLSGSMRGKHFELGASGATVGRAEHNVIHAGDAQLSRRHAAIRYNRHTAEFHVQDLGSTNGSFIQLCGPYAKPHALHFGDQLLLGNAALAINRFDHASACSIGPRRSMEDAHTVVQDLRVRGLEAIGLAPQSFFAVFDGHGGAEASAYLGRHMHHELQAALEQAVPRLLAATSEGERDDIVRSMLSACFDELDARFIREAGRPQAGSTATTALLMGSRLFTANVGDSRTVLCRKGGAALPLSNDHKPTRADEAARIRKAGGFVIQGRVMGDLAVSRAFGDCEFKTGHGVPPPDAISGENIEPGPLVVATPEITAETVCSDDEFLLLACDGLFDVFSNEEACGFLREQLQGCGSSTESGEIGDLQNACNRIVHEAIHARGSRDNVTVVVTRLAHDPRPTTEV